MVRGLELSFTPQLSERGEGLEIDFNHQWPVISLIVPINEASVKSPKGLGSEKFHVLNMCGLFVYCRIYFANILLKTFESIFMKDIAL